MKRLVQIPYQILHVFEPDGKPDHFGPHATGGEFLFGELLVRGRGRMDDQAAHVADIGQVREKMERLDEALAIFTHLRAFALEAEGENGARSLRQIFLRERVIGMAGQAGVGNPGDVFVLLQVAGDLLRVADVAIHAQRKRFQPLNEQERIHGRDAGADIADGFGARLHEEAIVAERVEEAKVVVGRRRRGDGGEAAEIEVAGIENDAGDGIAVAADEFRGGVEDDRRAVLHRAAEIRRGEGVVDDERNFVRVGQGGERFLVEDRAARIADGFAVERAGLLRDGLLPGGEVVRIDQRNFDGKLEERLLELRDGAAVQMRGGDDLITRRKERHQRDELRRHAAGDGERAGRAFKRGHAFLEDGRGRVADARVDVAVLLQLEKLRGLVGVVEDVGGRLVNRHGPRAGVRVGNVAGVDHPGLKTKFARGGTVRHPGTLSQAARHPSKMRETTGQAGPR
jgi:hypothetical protein